MKRLENLVTLMTALYWLVIVGVLVFALLGSPDVRRYGWFYTFRCSQWMALRLGHFGLYSERKYHESTELGGGEGTWPLPVSL